MEALAAADKNNSRVSEAEIVVRFEQNNQKCHVECIKDIDAMVDLGPQWKRLEATCDDAFIYFQTYDWCYQWVKHFAANSGKSDSPKLRIYCLYRDEELILIWPMMISRVNSGIEVLTFLTEPLGQYGNVVCNSANITSGMLTQTWKAISDHNKVDAITVTNYPCDSAISTAIGNRGYFNKHQMEASIFNLEAISSWDDYLASLKKSQRKKRNQRRNKLEKMGKLTFEVHYGGSDRYKSLISKALEMKMVWLEDTGRHSVGLSDPDARKFLRSLSGSHKNERGEAEGAVVQALVLDGKPIGIEIGICQNNHYCAYLGAFDAEMGHLSPGKVQMEMTQKWAKDTGFKGIDFLGEPAEYKASWTDSSHPLQSNSLPKSVRGFLYCVAWKLYMKPKVKEIYEAMGHDLRKFLMEVLGKSSKSPEKEKALNIDSTLIPEASKKAR